MENFRPLGKKSIIFTQKRTLYVAFEKTFFKLFLTNFSGKKSDFRMFSKRKDIFSDFRKKHSAKNEKKLI